MMTTTTQASSCQTTQATAGAQSSGASVTTPIASDAGNACHPAETAVGDTAAAPAAMPPTASGNERKRPCDVCGRNVSGKAARRYCSAACRTAAYRLRRNPDTARPSSAASRGTPTNTKRHGDGGVTLNSCQNCGREYEAKRPSQSKYCSGSCRRAAWLARHPDKARQLAETDKARYRAWREARGLAWEEKQNVDVD